MAQFNVLSYFWKICLYFSKKNCFECLCIALKYLVITSVTRPLHYYTQHEHLVENLKNKIVKSNVSSSIQKSPERKKKVMFEVKIFKKRCIYIFLSTFLKYFCLVPRCYLFWIMHTTTYLGTLSKRDTHLCVCLTKKYER